MLRKKTWTWGVLLAVFLLADMFLLLSVLTAPRPISSALLPTAEYLEQNPAPTPEFIFNHELLGSTISITVNQKPFARVGISADDISQHVSNHYQLKVDGNSLSGTAINIDSLTCGGDIKNPDTSKLKCWSGPTMIGFDVSDLKAGIHLASITIPDFDGVEHTYTWAFRYDPNFPTSDPNILPTLAPLPTETPTA